MAEVVQNTTRLPMEDREAIAEYVLSLPPGRPARSGDDAKQQSSVGEQQNLILKITAHQGWWEVRYEDFRPYRAFTTANEVHIPVGRAVKIKFESSDPIQGLWIPGLMSRRARATDRDKEVQLVAERADIYRSQCLELAKCPPDLMSLLVVAHPNQEFETWRAQQIKPAQPPKEYGRELGLEIFLHASWRQGRA
jgi:heme/copper-type cytochrome/quinol oxidase subunit 2